MKSKETMIVLGVSLILFGAVVIALEQNNTEVREITVEKPVEKPEVVTVAEPRVTAGVIEDIYSTLQEKTKESHLVEPEVCEDDFIYYQIPQEYIEQGGEFPEELQRYLWSQCKERGIDYFKAVSLIERESAYKPDALGDDGASKGYMQVQERWHKERIKEEYVDNLYDPYENIRVGLNYLQELIGGEENPDYHYVLMCYNMGEPKAKELFSKGIYSSEYSREVLQRAEEIEQEIHRIK